MTQFEKNYIGKGTRVKDLDIIRLCISKEKLEELIKKEMVNYDGNEYLIFEVAALKEKDDYGRTHTIYINKKVEVPAPKKKTAKK